MSEFNFIKKIKSKFNFPFDHIIGNDCALFDNKSNTRLISKDLLVEGSHFFPEIPLQALAYKSLMVNISDIISDGGKPDFFMIGLGIPQSRINDIPKLYDYFHEYCQQWGVPIIGGDTVKSPTFLLSITCVGTTLHTPWLRRNAKENDHIYVTGSLGTSALGLKRIKKEGHNLTDQAIHAHLFPPHLTSIVPYLANKVNAAIDISDGFLQDLSHILTESQKGALLFEDKIPICSLLKKDEYQLALNGGEDYQILFTSSQEIDIQDFFDRTSIKLSLIGKIIHENTKIYLQKKDKLVLLTSKEIEGFEHWQ